MLGGRIQQVNSQNQMAQSGNNCYLSIRVLSIEEIKKNSHQKITITLIQTKSPNHIALCTGKQVVCSSEVGALAIVFEKSATKLKPKPKQKLDAKALNTQWYLMLEL